MSSVKYVSASCDRRLRLCLESLGYTVESLFSAGMVAEPLSGHPDMFMCRLGIHDDDELISAADDPEPILAPHYPNDIPYNAACTGRYLIHTLKYTAPRILVRAEEKGMELIDVKQGYAKCSTVIVDEESIITYDDGIANACESRGLEVLRIRPGFVKLSGYNTGFIGGASGRLDLNGDLSGRTGCRGAVVFNGNLSEHPDAHIIGDFIESRGLELIDFPEWKLADIGSII